MKTNRFNGWVALLAFSTVALGSLSEAEGPSERGPQEHYFIACCAIAMGLSFITIVNYFFVDKLVGGRVEAITAIVILGLWCAGIAVVQNPENNLATRTSSGAKAEFINNANLYFFSWGAFISAVYVLASVAQYFKIVELEGVPTNLTGWYLLLAASVVVLGSASKLQSDTCGSVCPGGFLEACPDDELCRRTKYAVSLGVVNAGIAIISILWMHFCTFYKCVEIVFSFVVVALYCVGVGIVTTSGGPGRVIGNLYFSTWIGFGLSILIFFTCLWSWVSPRTAGGGEEGAETSSHHNKSEHEKQGESKEEESTPVANVGSTEKGDEGQGKGNEEEA